MSNFCDAATGKASKQKRDIYFVNCSKPLEKQWVAEPKGDGSPKCVPSESTGETRLAMLADLLAALPEVDRRELIADLSPADRIAIARRLIGSREQIANPREYATVLFAAGFLQPA